MHTCTHMPTHCFMYFNNSPRWWPLMRDVDLRFLAVGPYKWKSKSQDITTKYIQTWCFAETIHTFHLFKGSPGSRRFGWAKTAQLAFCFGSREVFFFDSCFQSPLWKYPWLPLLSFLCQSTLFIHLALVVRLTIISYQRTSLWLLLVSHLLLSNTGMPCHQVWKVKPDLIEDVELGEEWLAAVKFRQTGPAFYETATTKQNCSTS